MIRSGHVERVIWQGEMVSSVNSALVIFEFPLAIIGKSCWGIPFHNSFVQFFWSLGHHFLSLSFQKITDGKVLTCPACKQNVSWHQWRVQRSTLYLQVLPRNIFVFTLSRKAFFGSLLNSSGPLGAIFCPAAIALFIDDGETRSIRMQR